MIDIKMNKRKSLIKKVVLKGVVLSLILSLSLFTGCGDQNGQDTPTPDSTALTVQDFFPMEENVSYAYEGAGNEFATFSVYNEYVSDDMVQQRVDNGGTVVARVYQIKDGKLIRTLSKGEVYYREDLMDQTDDSEEVLLMEPIEDGTTWELGDGRNRTITSVSASIDTPSGKYEAIEVVTEGPNDTVTDYYAKGVGLVKSVFKSGDGSEVSSTLKELKKNTDRKESIQFFFPNINDDKIYIKNKEVIFKTNISTAQVLENGYKAAKVDNVGDVFSPNTKINRLTLNKDNKVELDLNDAFQTEMNAGSGYEAMILQSLANTFCHYYNAEELILTIDGKPYASGHIEMKEGESIKANYENTEEIDV